MKVLSSSLNEGAPGDYPIACDFEVRRILSEAQFESIVKTSFESRARVPQTTRGGFWFF